MIKAIVKDENFLKVKSEAATKADLPIADDLFDTLRAHKADCVGMAANMIGFHKNMIVVSLGKMPLVMINPVIVKKKNPYPAEEGCLSLAGTRKTMRYREITVRFQNRNFEEVTQDFSGDVAQIIQHECDHLNGVLI